MGDRGSGFLPVDSSYAGFLRRDCADAPGSFDSSSGGLCPIKIVSARGTPSASLWMYWRDSAPYSFCFLSLSGSCGTPIFMIEMCSQCSSSGPMLPSIRPDLNECATRLCCKSVYFDVSCCPVSAFWLPWVIRLHYGAPFDF